MPLIDDDPKLLVHAYVDGELDPANALAIEQRIMGDPALAAERDRIEVLQRALREKFPPTPAPAALRVRVERAVGLRRVPTRPTWASLAAAVALAVMAGSTSTFLALSPRSDATADAIVSDHIRALMAPQPTDVVSSDRHTVKPWFNGKIPESPRVIDLAANDFPLIGGRIDVVERKPVPTLVYHHRKHLISLTATHSIRLGRAIEGYNVIEWTEDGVTYWAVSDVAAHDLAQFTELFRSTPTNQ